MTKRILVVDDSELERLLVERMLSKCPEYRIELAGDGKEALSKLATMSADLVVTDLVMPEMDGLELVRAVRERHPGVPVVLLTAYGDESIAVDALEAGAAGYLPKARQAERLMATVKRVLQLAAADRNRERLGSCLLEYHGRFELENELELIHALVGHVQRKMAGQGFADTVERIRMVEALEEGLLNAMYHGNLEIDGDELAKARSQLDDGLLIRLVEERCRDERLRNRKILVVVHLTPEEARFVIRDEGRGFNARLAALGDHQDRFQNGDQSGLTVMRFMMDDVSYNAVGNELTMRKLRRRSDACPI